MLSTFSNSLPERKKFYKALDIVLDITQREELSLQDFLPNLTRMYGQPLMDAVTKSVTGEIKFYGLPETSMKLEGIEKHLKFIESYTKLQKAKRRVPNSV